MKCCKTAISFLIAIFVLLASKVSLAQDVVGCGGYIKSSSDIDLTKIQVGLYTERGTLKDSTDCSPTSGYFFLPVYSNAKYKIKVRKGRQTFQRKDHSRRAQTASNKMVISIGHLEI